MKIKKKTLQIFFMVKDLNPVFFELLIGSVKDLNKNLWIKNKKIIKLRQLNKTITLFPIYLNLFSTKKINNQKKEKQVYLEINRVNLIKEKQKLSPKDLNKELGHQRKVFFTDLYLNRENKISTSQVTKSTQILQNLKMM